MAARWMGQHKSRLLGVSSVDHVRVEASVEASVEVSVEAFQTKKSGASVNCVGTPGPRLRASGKEKKKGRDGLAIGLTLGTRVRNSQTC